MLQNRKLDAIEAAHRVAFEAKGKFAKCVGYKLLLEEKMSAETRIQFMTTAFCLKNLECDKMMEKISHLIIDDVFFFFFFLFFSSFLNNLTKKLLKDS